MSLQAFSPGQTQVVSVATTSGSIAVSADAPVVRILSLGPEVVFVRIGTGAQTAVVDADMPVVPNLPAYVTKGVGANTVALIADDTATADIVVYVTTGDGMG